MKWRWARPSRWRARTRRPATSSGPVASAAHASSRGLEFAQSADQKAILRRDPQGSGAEGQSALSDDYPACHRAAEAAGAAADAARGAGIPPAGPPAAATGSRCEFDRRCAGRRGAKADKMTAMRLQSPPPRRSPLARLQRARCAAGADPSKLGPGRPAGGRDGFRRRAPRPNRPTRRSRSRHRATWMRCASPSSATAAPATAGNTKSARR